MSELTCFKAYDVRGEIGVNIDADIMYRIGRAVAQHLEAKSVVIGFDARETSPEFAAAAAKGAMDAGAHVLDLRLSGTEEMYWAVTEYEACAGITVTASHNPINYNGAKIVKTQSQPLDDVLDFQAIKALAFSQEWRPSQQVGSVKDIACDARQRYVTHILGFVDVSKIKPLKVVFNAGNGAAGPTLDAVLGRLMELGAPLDVVRVHHTPDSCFPNGIPNPLLPENHAATADIVIEEKADFGVAFDGDFDRCFFFDETGQFIAGEYVVGLLAERFLAKEAGAKIVHDPRVIWNTQDIVAQMGGQAVQSKTGHAFIKKTMREHKAVYGGEMSAHHYFRDFAYCDSGMIPWLLVMELLSASQSSLSKRIAQRTQAFPSSGEINFVTQDAAAAVNRVLETYLPQALSLDETDGVSLTFENWRLNLRSSNTEPLMRLNVECKQDARAFMSQAVNDISKLL